jgi:3-phenylpropionate/trans-cinnamate dioxygenase ferredoxin reductase component
VSAPIAVVGASIAGVNAADAVRRAGWMGRILLLDRQTYMPYDRPPLSKRVAEDGWDPTALRLRDEAHWAAADVELRLGCEVLALRGDSDVLETTEGPIPFAGLVAATGCEARTLPFLLGDGERISTLRTLADAGRIRRGLQGGAGLVVVGGGFIGLELAAAATTAGVATHVVEIEEVPLARFVGVQAAEFVLAEHRRRGVTIHSGRRVTDADTADRVRLMLDDGTSLEADLVVVGIGVVPALEWLAGSGVELGNGIACDEYCATSRAKVYAAGDIAEWWNPTYGSRMRVEHWTTAREQGAAAGRNLAHDLRGSSESREPFRHVPYVWSDQYDLKIQILGQVEADDAITIEASDGRQFIATYGPADAPAGAVCVNAPREAARFRRILSAAT